MKGTFAHYAAWARGVGLPNSRLGWRVYICGRGWDFYCYTAIGFAGEGAAVDAVLDAMGQRNIKVRVVVVTVEDADLPQPPEP